MFLWFGSMSFWWVALVMMTSSNGNFFSRYWTFVSAIHRWPVNFPHKVQWRGALMFSLICVWINGWVNNRKAGDLRRYRAHYDITVMDAQAPYVTGSSTNIRLSVSMSNESIIIFIGRIRGIAQFYGPKRYDATVLHRLVSIVHITDTLGHTARTQVAIWNLIAQFNWIYLKLFRRGVE